MASGWREPTGRPFYRPVHTGPLAELVSYFFAATVALSTMMTPDYIETIQRLNNRCFRQRWQERPLQVPWAVQKVDRKQWKCCLSATPVRYFRATEEP